MNVALDVRRSSSPTAASPNTWHAACRAASRDSSLYAPRLESPPSELGPRRHLRRRRRACPLLARGCRLERRRTSALRPSRRPTRARVWHDAPAPRRRPRSCRAWAGRCSRTTRVPFPRPVRLAAQREHPAPAVGDRSRSFGLGSELDRPRSSRHRGVAGRRRTSSTGTWKSGAGTSPLLGLAHRLDRVPCRRRPGSGCRA